MDVQFTAVPAVSKTQYYLVGFLRLPDVNGILLLFYRLKSDMERSSLTCPRLSGERDGAAGWGRLL